MACPPQLSTVSWSQTFDGFWGSCSGVIGVFLVFPTACIQTCFVAFLFLLRITLLFFFKRSLQRLNLVRQSSADVFWNVEQSFMD